MHKTSGPASSADRKLYEKQLSREKLGKTYWDSECLWNNPWVQANWISFLLQLWLQQTTQSLWIRRLLHKEEKSKLQSILLLTVGQVVIRSNFIRDSDYRSGRIFKRQIECTWGSQNSLDNKQTAQVINKCHLSRSKAMKKNQLALKDTTFHHAHYVPWAMADPSCFIHWAGASIPPLGTGTPQHKWPLEALSPVFL